MLGVRRYVCGSSNLLFGIRGNSRWWFGTSRSALKVVGDRFGAGGLCRQRHLLQRNMDWKNGIPGLHSPLAETQGFSQGDEQYNWKVIVLTLWQVVQLAGPDSILAKIMVLNSAIESSEMGRGNPASELDASLFVVIKEVCK